MKKIRGLALMLAFMMFMVTGCGESTEADSAATESTATEATDATDATDASDAAEETIRIGFAIKGLDNPFYVKLADTMQQHADELGWELTILNADNDIKKETENMESLVVQEMDLIFMLPYDPETCIPSINNAVDAGIPVVCIDDAPGEGAKSATTVWSDNFGNGRRVGLDYAAHIGAEEPIKAILLAGSKGNICGELRRTGMFCGIIEGRLGISQEEAQKMAEEFNATLISTGKAECLEANFTVAGIGWGEWTEEKGLIASEDLITANSDLTLAMGENDQMLFGTITALGNAGIEGVDIIAAADGAQRGYDYIKEGVIFAIGENSPIMVGEKSIEVAQSILIDGVDVNSFEEFTETDAVSITIENVEERYDLGT